MPDRRPLRVLTWHVHGNYLYYLSQAPHEFHLVTLPGHPAGHAGRTGLLPWGDNVHEVPADQVRERDFDCVLYQSRDAFEDDRLRWLGERQRRLPALYVEHDPPREQPTDQRHPAADSDTHIVHVTDFNALMWDNGSAPVTVIEHGVKLPRSVRYSGERPSGLVVVNQLAQRGRRLGVDVYRAARRQVPLALAGMDSAALEGGLGEIANPELPALMAQYRFFFNPIRYTSLGLAVIEAMTVGLPVIGLATTEMPGVIVNGRNGFVHNRLASLVDAMRELLGDPALARTWGEAARATALERFGIERFAADWDRLFRKVTG